LVGCDPIAIGIGEDAGASEQAIEGRREDGDARRRQFGMQGIGIGILLDTFLVRTLLVPSAVALLGRANWWPSPLWRAAPPPSPLPIFDGEGETPRETPAQEQAGAR
jgi:hypothetical protein